MNKILVIVESPTKAKTISKYLNNNYIVKSSIGHIRDLPINNSAVKNMHSIVSKASQKTGKDQCSDLINRMGINPWCNWKARYKLLPGKKKLIEELKKYAKKAHHIYLATDLDREGEAIAWHLREVIGGDHKLYSRVVFNEITQNSILQAFNNPGKIDINRVNAQQARRFMDRIIGYMISPLLWQKISHGLSAGRVQSLAVRLIVEREYEIKMFNPKEYWEIYADIKTSSNNLLVFKITHYNEQIFRPLNHNNTMVAVELLKKAKYKVLKRKNKLIIVNPNEPFITSTLQQEANSRLGFSVKKTMLIAQHLYETGYITYMRTDSTYLSKDAINMARQYISKNFGKNYLPENANQFFSKKNSQEIHEAIRPSDLSVSIKSLQYMGDDAQKLYQLILYQFIACQMMPAQYDCVTIYVNADNFLLKTCWRTTRFDGWMKVLPKLYQNNKNYQFPEVNVGDELLLIKLNFKKCFTKLPTRFSEALLVKELEKRGIGRPSTYAKIISTIQERGYVYMNNHRFYAKKIGEIVTNRLKESFKELMDYEFTTQIENNLDQIASNRIEWKTVLDRFFVTFISQLDKAKKKPENGGMQPNTIILTSIPCPTCSRRMGIRTTITGVFLSCSGYILPSENCKTTISMVPDNEISNIFKENSIQVNLLHKLRRCKKCNTTMDSYFINLESKLYVCGKSPICDGYEIEQY